MIRVGVVMYGFMQKAGRGHEVWKGESPAGGVGVSANNRLGQKFADRLAVNVG